MAVTKSSLIFGFVLLVVSSSYVVLAGNAADDDEFVEVMPKSTHMEEEEEDVDVVPVIVEEEEEEESEPSSRSSPSNAREEYEEEDDESEVSAEKLAEKEASAEPATKSAAPAKRPVPGDVDEEEFEGFEEITKANSPDDSEEEGAGEAEAPGKEKPSLSEARVPRHTMRHNLEQYYFEFFLLAAVCGYGLNFFYGKSKNLSIANAWFDAHQELLASNFAVVGDDGEGESVSRNVLIREAENVFLIHSSGRINCDSMLVELQLLKRQDLTQLLSQFIRPRSDGIAVTVNLSADDMDPFVFAVAPKRMIGRLMKDHKDLGYLSPEKRKCDQYGVPASFSVVSETAEVLPTLLTASFVGMLKKYEDLIEYIHFSDQYVPNIDQDDAAKDDKAAQAAVVEALKSVQRVLLFKFTLPPRLRFTTPKQMEKLVPLMRMILYCVDRVKKCHLSREARERAVKNRSKMSEEVSKLSHQQRQERAQEKREDRLRKEKEKYMSEEDPEKARKLQEKAQQREAKKKTPKMKTAILRRG